MADTFLTWPNLATFSGAVAAVVFLVQFLKVPLDALKKVPTRIVVYAVSFIVLLGAKFFSEQAFSLDMVALCLVNALLVALSAMSLYEQTIAEPEAAKNTTIVQDTAQALADIIATQKQTDAAADQDTSESATEHPPTSATDASDAATGIQQTT
jgi:hypothetical protein